MVAAEREVRVIGLGNPVRGDDAAGLLVARGLRGRVPPGALVLEHSGEAAGLLEAWRGASLVVCVDAVFEPGARPGRIRRLDAGCFSLPAPPRTSTHGFGLAEAVELGRALGELPPALVVYGIVGVGFDIGRAPSPQVREAAREVAGRILGELRQREGGDHGLEEAIREQDLDA